MQPKPVGLSMDKKIQQARVILIGETHTNYSHHLNQLAIIKQAKKKWDLEGASVSIGLEMVQKPYQSYLDSYIANTISEREMLLGVEWYKRWGYDFRLYRPIFDFAKQNNIPLIALNIPREVTRKISKHGIKSLTKAERNYLPVTIDRSNTEYTARLKKIFAMHSHGKTFNEKAFMRFVEAQLAWDEGMALSASNYLKANPNRRMVILAGSGHLINRAGIPERLDRLLGVDANSRSMVILSHKDKAYTQKQADFSLASKDIQLPTAGLLGIGMKDTTDGVRITQIAKDGSAEKVGLMKNDILLMLDNDAIKATSDVNLWRLDKKPNQKVRVKVLRNQQEIIKSLVLGGGDN